MVPAEVTFNMLKEQLESYQVQGPTCNDDCLEPMEHKSSAIGDRIMKVKDKLPMSITLLVSLFPNVMKDIII